MNPIAHDSFNSMKNFIFLSLTLLASGVAFCDEEYTELFKVTIEASQAEVNVNFASSVNKVSIKTDKSQAASSCIYNVVRSGKELIINAVQTNSSLRCSYAFTLTIPTSLHFDVTLNQGNVKMSGDFTDSVLEVGEGSVEVHGKGAALQIKGKKTSFDFKGSSPLLAIDLVEGPITLDFTDLPRSGELQLDSKKGDVTITLPRGVEISGEYYPKRYSTEFRSKYGYKFLNRVYNGQVKIKR